MMWLNQKQYYYIVQVTADWTMDQLVALTLYLADAANHSWSKVVAHLEDIAQL